MNKIHSNDYRLKELDFLRGIAILLVLFRHQFLFDWLYTMGWIGVDLFFVLSGFLVSGLLFKEYLNEGQINVKRFLIRRGFKIYPIYFLFYVPYLIPLIFKDQISLDKILADLFFIQNYYNGWGYAYVASWSLAVEEHFYIFFSVFLFLSLKYNFINFDSNSNPKYGRRFLIFILCVFLACLLFRVYNNVNFPNDIARNFTMSHLRIDSLMSGVLIAYLYYFKKDLLVKIFMKFKYLLLLFSFTTLFFTTILDPNSSFFMRTFGFSFLYITFSFILTFFLIEKSILKLLYKIFTERIVNLVAIIGVASYSIYIIHTLVNMIFSYLNVYFFSAKLDQSFIAIVSVLLSILSGILMTNILEKYFLKLRNRYYP